MATKKNYSPIEAYQFYKDGNKQGLQNIVAQNPFQGFPANFGQNPQFYQAPVQAPTQTVTPATGLKSWVNITNTSYLKGALIGAGLALIATNPKVQQSVVAGAVRTWAMLQGSVEEMKEQIQDVKAELSQED